MDQSGLTADEGPRGAVTLPNASGRRPEGTADEQQPLEAAAAEGKLEHNSDRPGRIRWARLLKPVFEADTQR